MKSIDKEKVLIYVMIVCMIIFLVMTQFVDLQFQVYLSFILIMIDIVCGLCIYYLEKKSL